jgi:hypothetical protein
MSEQPKALQLAEKMESYQLGSGYAWHCHKAAAELRRLHEVNAELLEALKDVMERFVDRHEIDEVADDARAAIAKAEGCAV